MVDLREGLRRALRNFPGLLELHTYEPAREGRIFAEIAKWDTLENAMAAAKAFENGDERFMPYMTAIEELKFMGHFAPDKAQHVAQPGSLHRRFASRSSQVSFALGS